MTQTITQLQRQLEQLARELQRAGLWDSQVSNSKRLASCEPFCVDTLAFEQWLQWIFIPKLQEMLANPHFRGLPNRSAIHTMASHVFKDYPQETTSVCALLKDLDGALNALPSIQSTQ